MDTNAWYEFTDQNGERHVSRGDNGYIQQSVNQGIPIYVNDKGEWFTEPYLELTPEGYVSHIPSWFKNTAEYERWNSEFVPQMETVSATKDMWEGFRDTLKSLGAQGALRMETYKLARDAGITDQNELDKAYEDYLAIILEGAGQGNAKLDVLQDAGVDASVADIARKYKELSKEDLNDQMQGLRTILNAKGKGRWDQKTTREAFTLYRLLNLVADNPDSYGKDKEFEGLLEASEQQKFFAHTNSVGETIAEGLPLFTWAARLGGGLGALASGKGFGYGWKIENRREDGTTYNRYTGSELRGVEGSIVSGNVAGSVANILGTMAESAVMGTFINAKVAAGASGSVLSKIGTFSKTFGGSMVYDWFAHDLPIDLSLFATDRAAGMTAREAWYDDTKTQPLFGLFGPEVPYGLAMNLAGDAMMDLVIPVLGITGGAIWDSLDDISGGALNKIRENVAVKNLAVQQTISDMPVIGTGLRKFSDWLFGAENAALIREARKASILAGSTSFYADAQNLLTLKNHYGADVVAPMYKHLVDELGINDQIKRFNANANTYGGFGKTKVEWDTAKGGVARHLSEIVDDDIPRQVKQGLLDYQRLEELKGELDAEGGLLSNPKREKEIAELERRVEALPDDIKKFAQDMSDLNKRVEQMMVGLGLTTQDWIDALNADPRWKNYMTRQTLVPGGSRGAGAYDPATNKLLTGQRTGYYNPDQTLSPVMSLDMKVHAIGNAYAWNERAKALVGFEMIQGKITAGDSGVDIAKKIKEVRDTIAAQEATAAKLGYDTIVAGLSDRFTNVGATIRKLNEKLGSLENVTVKSAFTGMGMGPDPEIKGFKADFESGKVRIADDVLVKLDLSPADGASIIQNTYFLKRVESSQPEVPRPKGETPKTPVRTEEITLTPILGQDNPQQFSQKMFHGSGKTREEIYVGAKVPILGEGKYWAFDESGAKNFGDSIETETIVLERPLIIQSDEDWRALTKQAGWKFPNPLGVDEATVTKNTAALKDMVTKAGYDGIIIRVGKSQDGLLRDVFSIDQVVSYKTEVAADASSIPEISIGRGISDSGAPYEFELDADGNITKMSPITSEEGLAESVASFNQGYSISTGNVKAMGAENVHAINRMQMFYRDNGFVVPGVKVEFGTFYADGERHGSTYGYSRGVGNLSFDEETRTVVGTEHIFFNTRYYGDGPEAERLRARGEAESQKDNWHPKNATGKEATPIHENAHNIMNQLAVAEYNFSIRNGEILWETARRESDEISLMRTRNIPGSPSRDLSELERHIYERKRKLEADVVRGAFERMGRNFSDRALNEILGDPDRGGGLSRYARTRKSRESKYAETIAEAVLDYATNGNDAKELSKAIAAEIGDRLRKFQMVESPLDTMIKNGLDVPNQLFKDKQYAFPVSVKTDADRAKWLDQWRQKNPYLKGEFTEEKFQKANLWDAYFQKEIRAYDSAATSTSPEALITKSGKFIENYRADLAKEMVDEIKKLSVDEFDSDLAMMIMGRNGDEIAEAMDNFIIRQIEKEAEALARNMDGGATRDNINTALITLWSDSKVKESTITMLDGLVPAGSTDVRSKVDNLFETQANGLAAYEAIPLDAKQLMDEKEKLISQLRKENKAAMKRAEALDKNSSFIDGGTHLIHYREGGENVYVAVNDPVVASMLKKPYDFRTYGMISETAASIANFVATTYRLGTTGLNPLALVRNILRDPMQAMVTAGFNPLSMTLSPEVFYKTLRQYGLDDDTISMVTERIRNWSRSGTMTQEMRLGPGKYNSTYSSEVDRINKKLRGITGGKIITSLQYPLEGWEGFFRNQVGQQSFVKNFKRTGDVDKALGSALFDTSNATTNFSHSIGNLKRATSTIPYLSSAINGTVSFWRLFNMDPVGMTVRIVGGFMIPVMAITAWNLSSEENRVVYETLPEWYKQGHLIMVDPQGNVIAFPLPEEIQQFSGTARKLIEFTQDATPFALPTIAAQGAFGFVPFEVDGFFADDGSINVGRGIGQMLSGIMPQAFTTIYELAAQEDLFTGQDLSNMEWWNQLINAGTNVFGTGFKNVVNSIGVMCGVPEKTLVGQSLQNNLARDLFGMGFNAAKDQFNSIVGNPSKVTEDGKEVKATGLFAENEELQRKIKALDTKIATASDDEKKGYEEQKQQLTDDFINRVSNLMNNYQRLFQVTGGLEQWQKARLVQVLTLGNAYSSASDDSYQAASSNQAYLDERGLAIQRYQQIGLPSGPTQENLAGTDSFDIQAAVNRFYGVTKQATQEFKNAVANSGMKNVKNEFYSVMQQIYDAADEQGLEPDYDLIERIQARYLQMMDAALVPIINRYGINILNNNDFIDAVRRQVNGMIPSDDWRQSVRNAKKFLSSKDFPTTAVDVKKWLKQRYTSGMRNRNLASDPEVTEQIESIRDDIDAGRMGAAAGKIEDLKSGINKANFYISSQDLMILNQLNNMVK